MGKTYKDKPGYARDWKKRDPKPSYNPEWNEDDDYDEEPELTEQEIETMDDVRAGFFEYVGLCASHDDGYDDDWAPTETFFDNIY